MANKKINVEKLIADLNPPKWKIWITPKVRREAALSLGRMKKAEAFEPLLTALEDPKVQDSAMEALSSLPVPGKQAARTLKAILAYRQGLKVRFIEEFFNENRNSTTMKMVGDMPMTTMKAEPESFLGAALSIWSQLNPDREEDLDAAARQGLAPYSRKKFRKNIYILARNEIFPTWPELDVINNLFEAADEMIVSIAGQEAVPDYEPRKEGDDNNDASKRKDAEMGKELSDEALHDFVVKALGAKSAITTPMLQIPLIMEGFFKELKGRYALLDSQEIFKLLSGAVRLNCHTCGPLATEYTQGLLGKVEESFESGTPLDLGELTNASAGSFAKGHNPGCKGFGVELTFDPSGIEAPAKAIEARREAAEGKPVKEEKEAAPAPAQAAPEPVQAELEIPLEKPAPAPSAYNVLYKGELIEGKTPDEVKQGIAKLYKVDVSKVEGFFSGKPRVVKKGVNRETAEKMVAAFQRAGAKAYWEEVS
ncbi:PBS lyase HEAT domain protein repeat-containing protein [Desulfatibacillum aliphaticivorans]|uniref:PBS lyase HEAT domain protein repeat-containing protein n=1 Tax=Desulfatibacillum aliphaticivorans TaxID=218208 RepID=B8FGZ4_DESAL|nr:HEAT repeat domain-containing protein [Desulfatibacillum aliphaticivorans]ACL02082.1 PBS lyase HEAT domain protein repeat-containing protein [Desulfatibacillum aliphaticivorans]